MSFCAVRPVIFQSTLPVRGATRTSLIRQSKNRFQSTLPVRGATVPRGRPVICCGYFNPRSPCGERRRQRRAAGGEGDFNPRSPCGERHVNHFLAAFAVLISIHAPRAGSDEARAGLEYKSKDFNPRSPCGERLLKFESLFGFSNNSCMVIRFLAAPSSLL